MNLLDHILEHGWKEDWSIEKMISVVRIMGMEISEKEVRKRWTELDQKLVEGSSTPPAGTAKDLNEFQEPK